MPNGSIRCDLSSCEFETGGNLPEDGLRTFFTYFTESFVKPSFTDESLAERIIKHHTDTQEKNDAGEIIKIGHSDYTVTLENGRTGTLTAHSSSLSYSVNINQGIGLGEE